MQEKYSPEFFLDFVKNLVLVKFKENPNTKQRLVLICEMIKTNPATGKETVDDAPFSSKQEFILKGTNLEEIYQKMKDKIIEKFEKEESPWRLNKIIQLDLNISKSNPIRGDSYIPLPDFFKKQLIKNVSNGVLQEH